MEDTYDNIRDDVDGLHMQRVVLLEVGITFP